MRALTGSVVSTGMVGVVVMLIRPAILRPSPIVVPAPAPGCRIFQFCPKLGKIRAGHGGPVMSETLSLYEAFAEVPDPRQASGRRHPLQAILTLAAVAILSGSRSLYAIAQFGRDRGEEFARSLGFTRSVPPCCTSLHYLFAALDRTAFERAIRRW